MPAAPATAAAPAPAIKRMHVPRRLRLLGAAALALSSLGYLGYTQAGVFLESAAQEPVSSDLVVSVGGDWGERSAKAAVLYRQGYARQVLLTGAEAISLRPGAPYPASRLQVLADRGVPRDAVLLHTRPTSSIEEARYTLALMRQRGWRSVLVVSDPPHMRRLALLWAREFEDSGMQLRVVAADMAGWHPQAWWKNPWSAEFVRTEYMKLAYHLLVRTAQEDAGK